MQWGCSTIGLGAKRQQQLLLPQRARRLASEVGISWTGRDRTHALPDSIDLCACSSDRLDLLTHSRQSNHKKQKSLCSKLASLFDCSLRRPCYRRGFILTKGNGGRGAILPAIEEPINAKAEQIRTDFKDYSIKTTRKIPDLKT